MHKGCSERHTAHLLLDMYGHADFVTDADRYNLN